jgi:hypothetical protein
MKLPCSRSLPDTVFAQDQKRAVTLGNACDRKADLFFDWGRQIRIDHEILRRSTAGVPETYCTLLDVLEDQHWLATFIMPCEREATRSLTGKIDLYRSSDSPSRRRLARGYLTHSSD